MTWGLTSRIVPVTVYTNALVAAQAASTPGPRGGYSGSSGWPRTAALRSDLRTNRAGPDDSVTSPDQRGKSAKCRTCPPWDCSCHNVRPWRVRTVTSSQSDPYVPGDTQIHPRRLGAHVHRASRRVRNVLEMTTL